MMVSCHQSRYLGSRIVTLAIMAALACPACSTVPERRDGFDDTATSAERLAAIAEVARTNDRSRIADLVRQLTSSDIAVRWAAINTLRDLTGQDMGYLHDAPRAERQMAIDRWVTAIERGDFEPSGAGFLSPAGGSVDNEEAMTGHAAER